MSHEKHEIQRKRNSSNSNILIVSNAVRLQFMYGKSMGILEDIAVNFSFQDGCVKIFLYSCSTLKTLLNNKQKRKQSLAIILKEIRRHRQSK